MKYLIVSCAELHDQYECDADREPICMVDDYTPYNKVGYEIYKLLPNTYFELFKHYDETIEKR